MATKARTRAKSNKAAAAAIAASGPVYVIMQRPPFDRGVASERLYLAMEYSGWGHRTAIDWTKDLRDARRWTEKSGAYKLIHRRKLERAEVLEIQPYELPRP